jgi:SulP family sulfate permease
MAFTIIGTVGEDNPKAVIATTITSYAVSSIVTGLVFFLMGACKLGSLIGFFPRHILIGCIGGVGWFLVATGLEVSARLGGSLEYNLGTLRKLFELDTIFLWTIPLALAIILLFSQHFIKHSLFVPGYFLAVTAIFYFFVAVIPDLKLDELRRTGWVFAMPEAGEPFYHFYTLYGKGLPIHARMR